MKAGNSDSRRHPTDSFATTHWTTVLTAGRTSTPAAREALERLCAAYWYPLYAYIRRRGHPAADAEDLVQGFFERLLRLESLRDVRPENGRFRAFLLAAMNHYLADEWDRASAKKRDVRRVVSLDAQSAETRYQQEPVDDQSPEGVYARQWAITLLGQVVEQLRSEYEAAGKRELLEELRFVISGDAGAVPYDDAARKLGMSEPTVRVAAHRLRRRYREVLREQIAQTVQTADEVEDELRSLFASLAA